jgi:hypothetical protein
MSAYSKMPGCQPGMIGYDHSMKEVKKMIRDEEQKEKIQKEIERQVALPLSKKGKKDMFNIRTVGELKNALKNYPDDILVSIDSNGQNSPEEREFEISGIQHCKDHKEKLVEIIFLNDMRG